MQCGNNLKQIGIALHTYHDEYKSLPPAYVCDESGKRMHSWRVLLLPYMEQQELYKKYDVNGNGKLDPEEIASIKKDREAETLKKYDKNGNGKLDDDEKAAQLEDQKKRREEMIARRKAELEKEQLDKK